MTVIPERFYREYGFQTIKTGFPLRTAAGMTPLKVFYGFNMIADSILPVLPSALKE
jgi:hypothetical protein